MPKIKLGNAPKTFKHAVKFPLVGGGEDEIKVEYRYRSRTEFASFISDLYPDVKTGAVAASEGYDIEGAAAKEMKISVDHILGAVVSWDLDDALDPSSVARLVDEFPAAADALIVDYRKAIVEGRTKN